jgi:hypothetical protein
VNPRIWDYVSKAFNAKPIGMFVPPNWIGLALFAVLGLLNPGFWLVGLGMELGYLWLLGSNGRFQRFVDASKELQARQQWQAKIDSLVRQLNSDDQKKYRALEQRCRTILEQQFHDEASSAGLQIQGVGLGRLLWVYLRLLWTRQAIYRIIHGSDGTEDESAGLNERIAGLQAQLREPLSEDLRKSLTGQIEILQQRLERRREAGHKLVFLDAELTRIQEQVELVREQAAISADPEVLSQRIDQITTTLGGTAQWISDQQKIYGAAEDLVADPPPVRMTIDE